MTLQLIVFYVFAFITIASAVGVISLNNTVHCAISMLLTFFSVAVLFVLLEAEFLAAVQLYIYAGAIMVLVVFVVMLVYVGRPMQPSTNTPMTIISLVIALGIFLFFLYIIMASNFSPPKGIYTTAYQVEHGGQTKMIGLVLYSEYLFPFEVASILLLVAMIGAIVLPTRRRFRRGDKGEPL